MYLRRKQRPVVRAAGGLLHPACLCRRTTSPSAHGDSGHLRYIKEYREGFYTGLLLSGKLNSYLADADRQAQEQLDTIIRHMAKVQGGTKALKAEDLMGWVARMNNIRKTAIEGMIN